MKKTKCDGEFPCKRCKDDGLVCTAGVRKKMEYKQLPKGYAEVLENTQFALIATVHKLYSMVRNNQSWKLGEPELNDRGQPVIHDIAQKLGCIRPNSDIDLPVHSVFPEDERGMRELAYQLEEQQQLEDSSNPSSGQDYASIRMVTSSSTSSSREGATSQFQRASSSDLDHSDLEQDYRALAFGRHNKNQGLTMSPQSFASSNTDFELGHSPHEADSGIMFSDSTVAAVAAVATAQPQDSSSAMESFQAWSLPDPKMQQPDTFTMQLLQQQAMAIHNLDMLGPEMQERLMNQGLVESEFGTLKPHVLSGANSEVMMGMGDPMIFAGGAYDGDL